MIAKKKECLSIRNVCQDDFNDIEFVWWAVKILKLISGTGTDKWNWNW
jgi:hypothetical protein